jgi:hypothetical protein
MGVDNRHGLLIAAHARAKRTGLSGVSTARRSEEVTADAHTRALQQKQDWQQQREADMMLPSGAAQGKLCGREGDRSVLSPACYKWHGAARALSVSWCPGHRGGAAA